MKKRAVTLFLAAFLAAGTIFSPLSSLEVQAASWKKNSTGWWWEEDDKSWPANEWKTINGKTYNFDQNGYMRSGWYWDGKNWYYLGKANDGSMKTGWQKVNGKWYYMNSDGKMATGWKKVNGTWYYLESSGAMHSGWLWDGSNWYLLGGVNDGSMKTGWQKVNGVWYYMYQNGAMAANTWIGNYYVNNSGAWVQNAKPAQWIASGGRWWYRHTDGGYTTNNFETINGKVYYFDAAGWMVTGWQKIKGSWYYLGNAGDGAMKTSQWVGDYYVGEDGVMVTNTWIGDRYVDSSGKWDRNKKKEDEKPEVTPSPVSLKSISLDKSSITGREGDEVSLTVTYNPENTTEERSVAWSSSDSQVAAVENGKVTCLSQGTATITALVNGKSASCTVEVLREIPNPESISLKRSDYWSSEYIEVGGRDFIDLDYRPSDLDIEDGDVIWESSDENIVAITAGYTYGADLEGVNQGEATISARIGEKTASFPVVVRDKITVTGISFDQSEYTMKLGDRMQLMYKENSLEGYYNRRGVWESSNPQVATVDYQRGIVRAIGKGETIITCRQGPNEMVCKCKIIVDGVGEEQELETISLERNPSSIRIGDVIDIDVLIYPVISGITKDDIEFEITESYVYAPSVDGKVPEHIPAEGVIELKDGKVTGIKGGVAVITATVEGKSASWTFYVG